MGRMLGAFRARTASTRGQAMLEMAMTFPLVIVIILVVIELGFGFHAYTTVVSAARAGARAGAVYLFNPNASVELNRLNRESGQQGTIPKYVDNVRDTIAARLAPIRTGSSHFDKGSSIVGEPTGDVTVDYTQATIPVDTGTGDLINVMVVYHYRPLTGFFDNMTIDMKAQSSERME